MKNHIILILSLILACLCTSCEPEEDFGVPSKIKISGKGETIDIKGRNDLIPVIRQIELLDNYSTHALG